MLLLLWFDIVHPSKFRQKRMVWCQVVDKKRNNSRLSKFELKEQLYKTTNKVSIIHFLARRTFGLLVRRIEFDYLRYFHVHVDCLSMEDSTTPVAA